MTLATTTTRRTCDCDHGERDVVCGAPAVTRHWCKGFDFRRLCRPCRDECHNRENERWA